MPVVHYLNVNNGDCSIIQHESGNVTVIDVCNARKSEPISETARAIYDALQKSSGNFNQKAYPENPIEYLKKFGIRSLFRFVLTHPDMDHMDGIKDLFEEFKPMNFYDIDNQKEMDFEGSPYRKDDWEFYTNLRDTDPKTDPKRQTLFSGDDNQQRTKDANGNRPGDSLYILSPTPELVESANQANEFNDCSYVILYNWYGKKVLFCGDAENETFKHILSTHKEKVSNIDLLIAPHHGRKGDLDFSFLDVLNPKMTFFGNASSEHLAYDAWNYRNLKHITNNQAGCMVVNLDDATGRMPIYVTNEKFARQQNPNTFFVQSFNAWALWYIR
jgi:Predicted hydrolase (metallo-beta-lactamase superfamily)